MNQNTSNEKQAACQLCGTTKRVTLHRGMVVRPPVVQLIVSAAGHWDENGWICSDDLHTYQHQYVQSLLVAERGELTELDLEVLRGLKEQEILSKNPEIGLETDLTFGQRMADRIAAFGGSWAFIIFFGVVLFSWMFVNSYALATHPFDPFPYILLNLMLSALASIQAPLIMMSQNRQEARDRIRAMNDYQVNLKAELEIRQLHQKIDHLLSRQWERLVEIQEIQMELINEVRGRR